jgi:hypothetical protein
MEIIRLLASAWHMAVVGRNRHWHIQTIYNTRFGFEVRGIFRLMTTDIFIILELENMYYKC